MPQKTEVTIADVARMANVSVSTVSRILNDRPDVADGTRERVLQVIKELGFVPHAQARRLAAGQSRTIALLDPMDHSGDRSIDQLHLDFMLGAATAAGERDYFFNVLASPITENKVLDMYRSVQVDGVILMEIYLDDWRVNLLRANNYQFDMIGRCTDNTNVPFIDIDFATTTQVAFDHLVSLGHSKIGFIGFQNSLRRGGFGPAVRAWSGFQASVEKHGLRAVGCETVYHATEMAEATSYLLKEEPGLTAIVAMTDAGMVGVFNALRQAGRNIPGDFSVIGLAIDRLAELMTPSLTAIRFPSFDMGYEAAAMLIEKLDDGTVEEEQRWIQPELVIRNSTGPAMANG